MRRRPAPTPFPAPGRRRGVVRVPAEVARALAGGHPWVYRQAVRPLPAPSGEVVDVLDPAGAFLGRGLWDADGPIAVRLLTRDPRRALDASLLAERVAGALAARRALLPEDLTAYRVVNGEADGLPGVTCDRFGDFLLAHLYTAAWEPHEAALLDSLAQACGAAGVHLQRRYQSLRPGEARPGAEHARGAAAPADLEVREDGLRFEVDLTAPLSPGLFPDLRLARRWVRAHAAGRRFLNCFSFTGAMSVAAAAAGASEVTSVDAMARAHARARRNFARNDLDPERFEFIADDALKVLSQMAARGRRYDLVVLDPPAFGSAGGRAVSSLRDYADLVAAALGVLAPAGHLLAIGSARRLTAEEFERALGEGAGRSGAGLRVVERIGQPPDFPSLAGLPESAYLKCVVANRV